MTQAPRTKLEFEARAAMARFQDGMVVTLPSTGENPDATTFVLMAQANGWWSLVTRQQMVTQDDADWEVDPSGRIIRDCFETPFWASHLVLTGRNLMAEALAIDAEPDPDKVVSLAGRRAARAAQ